MLFEFFSQEALNFESILIFKLIFITKNYRLEAA
jgi:hypothetical protein